VNRHRDQPLDTEFELQDKQFSGPVEVSEVNGPDIKAENDFGRTQVKTGAKKASAEARKLSYRFPAHSYTMLKARIA
jgi:alpha-N-arabinofuranosidase